MHSCDKALPNGFVFSHFRRATFFGILMAALSGCGQDPFVAGQKHMQSGEYKAAAIQFKNAVQAEPNIAPPRVALADALERLFDLAGAEQQLRKALESGGDPNILLPRIAFLMLDGGADEKLVREFKDRRLDSPAADSNLRAAVAAALVGRAQLAQATQQLQEIRETTPAVQVARAQVLAAEGKRADALATVEGALREAQHEWWTLRAVGRLYAANGDREHALAALKQAREGAPWHPGVASEYGELLVSAGRLDEALALRNWLMSAAPNSHWANYLNAMLNARQGHGEESHAAALKTLAVAPEHVGAMLLAASVEIKKGDYWTADNRLTRVLKQRPELLAAYQLQARSQLMAGKSGEAERTARRGLALKSRDPELLGLLADIQVRQGNRKVAAATLETLLMEQPDNGSTLLRLSQLKTSLGDRAAADKLLDRAAMIGKDDPAIRDQIVSTALRSGDSSRARKLAEYAMKSRPKDPSSHLTLAAALATQNDPAGAWKATVEALDLEPTLRPALVALTSLAGTAEQKKERDMRYAKAVQAKGAVAEIYLDYATLLRAGGKDSETIKDVLEKGLAVHPNAVSIRTALIEEALRAGQVDRALSLAQSGAAAIDAHPEATALLGEVYGRVGKNEQATEVYRKLAANYPQRADWQLRLAQLEAGAGRKPEAARILRTLITERPFDISPYVHLANLLIADNPSEALAVARQLGDFEGRKSAALLLEGELLAKTGKSEEALQRLSAAGRAGAQPAATIETIKILDRSNRKQAAEQELADALRRFSDHPAVLSFASDRALAQGSPEKAVDYARKLVARNPANPLFLNELAWKEIQANQPEALGNARKAAALLPDNPTVLNTLGVALARAGKPAEAIPVLRAAANLSPTASQFRIDLAEQLLASGDRKAADATLKYLDGKPLSANQEGTLVRLRSMIGS